MLVEFEKKKKKNQIFVSLIGSDTYQRSFILRERGDIQLNISS